MNKWFVPLVLLVAPALLMAGGAPPNSDSLPTEVAKGRQIYEQYCAACHGWQGEGAANWNKPDEKGEMPPPPHDETGHTWHHNDKLLFELTKFGPKVTAGEDYKTHMPAYEGVLSDNEIIAVLSYIKSTWPEEVIEIYNKQINNN